MNKSIRKVSLILLALTMVLTMGVSLLFAMPNKSVKVSAESAQGNYVIDFEAEADKDKIVASADSLACWPREIDNTIALTGKSSLRVTPTASGTWPSLQFIPLNGATYWDLSSAYSISIWVRNGGDAELTELGFYLEDADGTKFHASYGGNMDKYQPGVWTKTEITIAEMLRHFNSTEDKLDVSQISVFRFGSIKEAYTNRSPFNVDNFRVNYTKPTISEIASQVTAMAEDLTMMTGASIYAPTAENALDRGIRFGMTLPKANYDAMLELAEPNGIKLDFGLFVKPQTTGYSYELSDKNLFQEGALYYWDDNDLSTWNGYPTTNPKTGNTLYEGWSAEIYDIYNLLPREYEDTVYLYGFLVGFDGAPSITRDYVCRGYVTVSVDGVRSNVLANYVDENGVSIGRDAATTVAERNEKEANVMRSMFDVAMAVADKDESLRSALEKAYFTSDVKNVDTKINISVKLDGVTKYTTQIDGKLYSPVDTSKLSYDTSKGVNCSKGLTVVSNTSALAQVRAGRNGATTVDVEFITKHGFEDATWTGAYQKNSKTHQKKCSCGVVDTVVTNCSGDAATCTVASTCKICTQQLAAELGHDLSNVAYSSNGSQHWQVCKRCSAKVGTASHDTTNVSYSTNASNHWKLCTVCSYKVGNVAHDTTDVAYSSDGTNHWKVCKDCSYQVDKTGHTASKTISKDATYHWYECTACGYDTSKVKHSESSSYTTDGSNHWKVCTVCAQITTAKAAHVESSSYSTNGTYHWKECTICNYDMNKAGHTEKSTYTTSTSQHWKICSTCSYVMTTKTNHVESSSYSTDGTNHWKECTTCGYDINPTKHSYSQKYDTTNHWNECGTCKKVVDSTKHTASSTYTTNSSQHWKKCTGCEYKMSPANHTVGTAATFWAAAKCKTCSVSYGSVRATSNYTVGAWNNDSDKYVADRYTTNASQDAWDIGISTTTKYSGTGGLQIDRKGSAPYPCINFAWNDSEYWNLSDAKQVSLWICCPANYNNVIGLNVASKALKSDGNPTYSYDKLVSGQTGGKWLQLVIDMKDVLTAYPSIGLSSCRIRFVSTKYVDQSSFYIDDLVITAGTEKAATDLWNAQQKETRYNYISGNQNLVTMSDSGSFVPKYSTAGRSRGCIEVTLAGSTWGTWWSALIKQTSSNERWSFVGATEVSVLVWQNTGKSVPFWIELRHYENSQYVDYGGSSVVNVPNNTWTRISVTLNSGQLKTDMRVQLCVSGEYTDDIYGTNRAVKIDEFAIRYA